MQKLIQFSRGEINELQISVQLQKIWALITSNVICYPETQNVNSSSLARLQMMMQFIHSNYPESISLLDIAKVGEVSISTALNLFRNVLNTSPVNYLICYRLRKAALLLTNTEKKVSAISIETGFSNTDYFCKTFKRMYSLTPTEYRNVKKWIIRRKKGDLSRPFPELEGFHFHTLRHTYTTNLLSNGAQPKDVQELLGHSDVSTTMNVYAHATREAKRNSARLLDKVAGQ